jgi:serine/threonine protein kinase/Tfp pilus assembly protein PilF
MRLAEEMTAAWRRGERPCAEDYLARYPQLTDEPEAAVQLIYEEICLREEFGLKLASSEVIRRFPQWQAELSVILDCHQLLRPSAPTVFPEVGQTFGDLCLLAELGRGAQGRVFLATQPLLADRPVVLKLTPCNGQEHVSLARLQHTHIMPLYWAQDVPEHNLRALCMPYLGGTTLARLLQLLQPIPFAERSGLRLLQALDQDQAAAPVAARRADAATHAGPVRHHLARSSYVQTVCWIGYCLADALHYAHERGLVHLDLKPSNVLLAADGQPMLLDFHLAREPVRLNAPVPEWLGGTQAYMSPEQRLALAALREGRPIPQPVDARSDVYSLGLLLYQTLGGTVPGAADTSAGKGARRGSPDPAAEPGGLGDRATRSRERQRPDDTEQATASSRAQRLPRLDECNPQVSAGLADILSKCLEPDPQQRYADAAALAADLRRHLGNQPLRGVGKRRLWERLSQRRLLETWGKWRRRQPHALRQLALVGLLLLGILVWVFVQVADYRKRLHEAQKALIDGQNRLSARKFAEAERILKYGLERAQGLLLEGELASRLAERHQLARWARQADSLHALTEQVRFEFDTLPVERLGPLAEQCETIWKQREEFQPPRNERLGADLERRVRYDLLDLAILWAGMRVRLADDATRAQARLDALRVLAEAEKDFGPSPVLYEERWEHLHGLGRDDDAWAARRKARALPPQTSWDHYALGRICLLRHRDPHQAAVYFERALELHPQGFWPNFYQGMCAYQLGRYEEAAAAFRVCVVLAPDQAHCWYHCALVHAARGAPDRALRDYDRALQLQPDLEPALLNRGILHYRNGQALSSCQLVLQLDPSLAAVLPGALGWGRERTFAQALADFDRVLQKGADKGTALFHLALVYRAQGNNAKAQESLMGVAAEHPRAAEARLLLMQLQTETGPLP